MVHLKEVVDAPYPAFENRQEAGWALAEFLMEKDASVDVIFAVPSGGVAVGRAVAERLGAPFDLILVRKLPLPMEPEAGFGAVTLHGEVELNDALVRAWGLSGEDIRQVIARVTGELRQREHRFLAGRERLDPAGKGVLLVDDGLASGFTMKVAVKGLQRREPLSISIGVPDAPLATIRSIEPFVDDIYCLAAQRWGGFAVASFYKHWHDLTDDEVLALLRAGPAGSQPGGG
jgi:putative phosphoribosyl transferase